MKTFELPKSISTLAENLTVLQMVWQGVPVQIPKFAIYAVLESPVFDRLVYKEGRSVGLLKLGRYQIPVLDPFRGDIELSANYAVIVSHTRGNRFGLYGYPADHVETDIQLPVKHASVPRIVRDYV